VHFWFCEKAFFSLLSRKSAQTIKQTNKRSKYFFQYFVAFFPSFVALDKTSNINAFELNSDSFILAACTIYKQTSKVLPGLNPTKDYSKKEYAKFKMTRFKLYLVVTTMLTYVVNQHSGM
jgi:hypothetical protein